MGSYGTAALALPSPHFRLPSEAELCPGSVADWPPEVGGEETCPSPEGDLPLARGRPAPHLRETALPLRLGLGQPGKEA